MVTESSDTNAGLETIIEDCESVINRTLARFNLCPSETDDVRQNIYVILVQEAGSLHSIDNMGAWITTIAKNQVKNFLRTKGRERNRIRAYPNHNRCDKDSMELKSRQIDSMNACMDMLDPESRKLLKDKYLEGQSYGTIAKNMGCTVRTVGNKLKQARRKIISLMEE